MSVMRSVVAVGVVLLMASGVSFATTHYAYDSGGPISNGITWGTGYLFGMNIFTTGADNVIDQLQVAWGNLPDGTSAKVILYGLPSGASLPSGGQPSGFQILREVDTTVTSDQANGTGLTFDGVHNPEHFSGAITNPVWTSYNITPTTITAPRFAVATLVYDPNENTITPNLVDLSVNVPGAYISWIGFAGSNGSVDLNTNTDVSGGNNGYIADFGWAGYSNNPYLIRAEGTALVPEPLTMASVLLAMSGLGAYLKRRKAR